MMAWRPLNPRGPCMSSAAPERTGYLRKMPRYMDYGNVEQSFEGESLIDALPLKYPMPSLLQLDLCGGSRYASVPPDAQSVAAGVARIHLRPLPKVVRERWRLDRGPGQARRSLALQYPAGCFSPALILGS